MSTERERERTIVRCECGSEARLQNVKNGKNAGRQFWTCKVRERLQDGSWTGCDKLFKWADQPDEFNVEAHKKYAEDYLAKAAEFKAERDNTRKRPRLDADLVAENTRLKDALDKVDSGVDPIKCSICLSAVRDTAMIPCGHTFCGRCLKDLPKDICPFCRERVDNALTIYFN